MRRIKSIIVSVCLFFTSAAYSKLVLDKKTIRLSSSTQKDWESFDHAFEIERTHLTHKRTYIEIDHLYAEKYCVQFIPMYRIGEPDQLVCVKYGLRVAKGTHRILLNFGKAKRLQSDEKEIYRLQLKQKNFGRKFQVDAKSISDPDHYRIEVPSWFSSLRGLVFEYKKN